MITLLFLVALAIIFTVACILIDIAWPIILVLIVGLAIDISVFKSIFKGGKKK